MIIPDLSILQNTLKYHKATLYLNLFVLNIIKFLKFKIKVLFKFPIIGLYVGTTGFIIGGSHGSSKTLEVTVCLFVT